MNSKPLSERSSTFASEGFLTFASGGASPLASSAWQSPIATTAISPATGAITL